MQNKSNVFIYGKNVLNIRKTRTFFDLHIVINIQREREIERVRERERCAIVSTFIQFCRCLITSEELISA